MNHSKRENMTTQLFLVDNAYSTYFQVNPKPFSEMKITHHFVLTLQAVSNLQGSKLLYYESLQLGLQALFNEFAT